MRRENEELKAKLKAAEQLLRKEAPSPDPPVGGAEEGAKLGERIDDLEREIKRIMAAHPGEGEGFTAVMRKKLEELKTQREASRTPLAAHVRAHRLAQVLVVYVFEF